jgi:hypothetical protein
MYDPISQMEMIKSTIESESQSSATLPKELDEVKAIELLKEGHDSAVTTYRENYGKHVVNKDPMLAPVIIGCLAHDYIQIKHAYGEETFKAALTKYRVFENPEIGTYMQQKQMELMNLSG